MTSPAEINSEQLPTWAQVAFAILDKYGLATLMSVIFCFGLIFIIWKWHSKTSESIERQLLLLEKIMDRVNLILGEKTKED